ncbi:HAD family phosphatase [Oceanobacillus sp. J11TS1]|uniref:HAD family hydrolase n=1 Tax=Oceanobacillus sp. J11TS1 TaxID=2807191 RepID=UPI001B0B484A|nr:HAD family phosphatase [Oceanobacillus sp. J11TS1]GIO21669.1 haloacid dehalogenase [Oceanobacillus sp. J11TS1]
MEDLQLVIFDMDGLLFDTERPSYQAMKIVMEKNGFDFQLETYKRMIGISDHGCEQILKDINGKDFPADLIFSDYDIVFKEILTNEGIQVKPGVEELLAVLDKKGIQKCIASSSSRETIHNYLAITGLTEQFEFYLSGEEVKKGKPSPDIFLEACRRARVGPESALVLEDSLHGLRAATRANIRCIIVPDLIEPNEEMERDAMCIVSDLKKVSV